MRGVAQREGQGVAQRGWAGCRAAVRVTRACGQKAQSGAGPLFDADWSASNPPLDAVAYIVKAFADYGSHAEHGLDGDGRFVFFRPPSWDDGQYAEDVIGYADDGVPIMGRLSQVRSATGASLGVAESGYVNGAFTGGGTLDEYNVNFRFNHTQA